MFHSFYGLSQDPFHVTPDPSFLYLSPNHKQAFETVLQGIESREDFILLSGEVGSGKTTLLRSILEAKHYSHLGPLFHGLDTEAIETALIFNPDISFKNLLRVVFAELALPVPQLFMAYISQRGPRGTDYINDVTDDELIAELLRRLQEALLEKYALGKHVLLIIDEAQNMPGPTLNSLRRLADLSPGREGVLQIILIGQTEVETILDMPDLKPLKNRIRLQVRLTPLTFEETCTYVRHRLRRAGLKAEDLFNKSAYKRIYKYSRGIPRLINTVCTNALIHGAAQEKRPIEGKLIDRVIAQMEGQASVPKLSLPISLAVACMLILTGLLLTPLPSGVADPIVASLHDLANSVTKTDSPASEHSHPLESSPSDTSQKDGGKTPQVFWLKDIRFPEMFFENDSMLQDRKNDLEARDN
jgi:general secretion pathway protein A